MKYSLCFLLIIFSLLTRAQLSIDCNSHRFDQEIFSTVTTTTDIQYGSNTDANGANVNLTLDVYEPAGDTMQFRPLIIWAHGGSFLSGTKNDVDVVALSQHFAKRGYVCASINYRLGIPFPINQESALKAVYRAVQDMRAAIRFFRKDANTTNLYKIDPNTIIVGGSSAGAFTALHVAYLDKYNELPITVDTVALGTLEGNSGNPGYSSSVSAVVDLCGALGNKTYVEAGNVPFVAMHGTNDNVVPYATDMIYLLSVWPIMIVDGSYSISDYATSIGVHNEMYTFFGADHVPFVQSAAYMDTTVRFVSNFLYRFFLCNPTDPAPYANTFTTGLHSAESLSAVNVFPNPATDHFNIQLSGTEEYQLRLFDAHGRVVLISEHVSKDVSIDTRNYSSGIYFYLLKNSAGMIKGKFIKE